MPFPWSLNGELVIAGSPEPALVAERLATALRQARATDVTLSEQSVTFRGGLFRLVSGWNILLALETGSIVARRANGQTVVRYSASLRQLLVVGTLLVGLFVAPFLLVEARVAAWHSVLVSGAAWLWLVGGNVLLAAYRFPRWIMMKTQD